MTLMKKQPSALIEMAPEFRTLLKTIVDAAAALGRLLPDEELEHGF